MVEPNNFPTMCRNGHAQTNVNSKFCIYCGTALNAPPVQQNGQSPVNANFPPANNSNFSPPVNYQPQTYPNQPPSANLQIAPNFQDSQVKQCAECGGDGRRLAAQVIVCAECGWLRPLAPGYTVEPAAFQWSEDGTAMSALRSITPLNAAAQAISDKVGRRWIESTFNAVRLSEKQLPDVYAQAVLAARVLGMSNMPDVYVSGEIMWDCRTFGSDTDAFVIIGTSLAANFHGAELLFLFAREMGHCRAGHALWKTVIKFLMGEQHAHKGLMGNGLFGALGSFMSPSALIEGAIEMPLLAWARQAEITADRAGLLAVGDEEIARRVLLSWTLKSPFLYQRINVAAWLEQQAATGDGFTKLSELTTSSTPYITRRLKLMEEFAAQSDLQRWQAVIKQFTAEAAPAAATTQNNVSKISAEQPKINAPESPSSSAKSTLPAVSADIRTKCSACATPLRIPAKILEGKQQISVRCPNAACAKVIVFKKKPDSAASKTAA